MILINSSPKNALKIFQPFLPIFVPVGIGCLLAVTERKGINAKFIDEQLEDNIIEKVSEYVKQMEPPYIFGFSVLTAAFKDAILLSQRLKELYPDCVICFGGVHPTAMPEEVLAFKHIDVVVRGEGEQVLPELYSCIKEGKPYTHLDNLSYRRDEEVVHNKISSIVEDLDSLPSFPYHLFASKRYDLGFVISSRGCPHKCIFCSNRITTGRRYRFRSAEVIIDEIDMLYHKYGIRHILFLDDNLLVSKKRIYSLLDELRKKGFDKKITFSFQARGDNVDYKLLKDLYSAGFRSVFFGIETASERIMQTINKGETVEQCIKAVHMAKLIGFHVSATFIYAFPGETHGDRMDCLRLSRALDLNMVRYNNATPYPGTALYDIAKKENRLKIQGLYENFNSVSTFIENPFKKIPFSYVPQGSTEKEIRNDILFSYLAFYLDIHKVKRIFTRPDEGVGWFNAGNRLSDIIKKSFALFCLIAMLFAKFSELFLNVLLKRGTTLLIADVIKVLFKDFKK